MSVNKNKSKLLSKSELEGIKTCADKIEDAPLFSAKTDKVVNSKFDLPSLRAAFLKGKILRSHTILKCAFLHQPPNNISSVFKPELIISQAINLSEDFIPIDEIKLAEIANFTPKEISMLKLFWNPCFNSTWIYLSDEIILNFLTNSKTEDAVNNFIRKVLITNNEKEIDYLQVDKNAFLDNSGK